QPRRWPPKTRAPGWHGGGFRPILCAWSAATTIPCGSRQLHEPGSRPRHAGVAASRPPLAPIWARAANRRIAKLSYCTSSSKVELCSGQRDHVEDGNNDNFGSSPNTKAQGTGSLRSLAFQASPSDQREIPSRARSLIRNCPGFPERAGKPPALGSQTPGVVTRKLRVVRNIPTAKPLPTTVPPAQ